MPATAVDALPGGALDLLAAATPGLPGVTDVVAGRTAAASEVLHGGTPSPLQQAWSYLAAHGSLLSMPDGSALPYVDVVDERPDWPRQPEVPEGGHPDHVTCQLAHLLTGLRDLRGLLPPLVAPELAQPGVVLQMAAGPLRYTAGLAPLRPGLGPHLDLLAADLLARCGQEADAWQLLRSARDGFAATGDPAGAAATALVAGDWLAAPFASPVTWGFSLATPTGTTSDLQDGLRGLEQSAPADAGAAADAYAEAERLYLSVGQSRGVAHVAWRRCYLHLVSGDVAGAVDALPGAVQALEAAGDAAAAQTARVHTALAGLADGRLPDPAAVAAPVVAWAAGPGSLSHAIALGRLFARAGRRWYDTERRPERALAAAEVAAEIWRGLDRPVARSQALGDQAEILRAVGARSAALVQLETAGEIGLASMREPPDVMDVRRRNAVLLACELYNLANAVADVPAMDRAQERMVRAGEPLRPLVGSPDPDIARTTSMLLGLVDAPERAVARLLYQGQLARDDGDAATAAARFDEAMRTAAGVRASEQGQLVALVHAFRLEDDAAGAAYRPWIAARLAEVPDIVGAVPGAESVQRQLRRQLHDQALMFSVRIGDLASARSHLAALAEDDDPWWSGLGPAWEHEEVLGRLEEAEGDLEGAARTFGRAVSAAESVRQELTRDDLRQAFGADRAVQQVYRNAARVELRRRDAAEAAEDAEAVGRHGAAALHLLELGRSRALTDLLSPGSGPTDDLVLAWRGARADDALARDRLAAALSGPTADPSALAERRAEAEQARAALDGVEASLRATDPRFWQLGAGRAPSAEQVALAVANLPDGHVALVYSIDRPDLVACAVDRTGVRAAVWSRDERRPGVLAARLVGACRTAGPWREAADELGALLLGPFAGVLEQARTVHVVASGVTLQVPFPALPVRGRALADLADVTLLPALVVHPLLAPTGAGGTALCVGDPAGMGLSDNAGRRRAADPLPGARVEAAAVAEVLGVAPLIGESATETAAREGLCEASVAHLATHGVVRPGSPLESSVLLADGQELTVAELMSMRLKADLVVLSACETGAGTPLGGDELLGLGRGLLAAGARSAVVSLWPVDDEVAAVLMTRFHEERVGGASTAAALRAAMAWVRSASAEGLRSRYEQLESRYAAALPAGSAIPQAGERRVRSITSHDPALPARVREIDPGHPRYWAPFVLIGR